jgi:hypothetical protein
VKTFAAICFVTLAVGAASAEKVVVGYRTYMSSFPFYGC